ncbi:hypothetical protein ACL6C3_22470 [Capilliphycus salinus ALCB114379]
MPIEREPLMATQGRIYPTSKSRAIQFLKKCQFCGMSWEPLMHNHRHR